MAYISANPRDLPVPLCAFFKPALRTVGALVVLISCSFPTFLFSHQLQHAAMPRMRGGQSPQAELYPHRAQEKRNYPQLQGVQGAGCRVEQARTRFCSVFGEDGNAMPVPAQPPCRCLARGPLSNLCTPLNCPRRDVGGGHAGCVHRGKMPATHEGFRSTVTEDRGWSLAAATHR